MMNQGCKIKMALRNRIQIFWRSKEIHIYIGKLCWEIIFECISFNNKKDSNLFIDNYYSMLKI